jgi:hypothetical protein
LTQALAIPQLKQSSLFVAGPQFGTELIEASDDFLSKKASLSGSGQEHKDSKRANADPMASGHTSA